MILKFMANWKIIGAYLTESQTLKASWSKEKKLKLSYYDSR